VVEGVLGPAEWRGARLEGSDDVRVYIDAGASALRVGLATPPLFVASLCVAVGDTVRVYHASAALGSVTYLPTGDEWLLRVPFVWRLRRTDLSDEAVREREAHFSEYGWVANTMPMGEPGQTEFRISMEGWPAERVRLAVGLMRAVFRIDEWMPLAR